MGGKALNGKKVSWEHGNKVAETVLDLLDEFIVTGVVAGSIRRKKPIVGDVDLVVVPNDVGKVLEILQTLSFQGGDFKRTGVINGVQVDVLFSDLTGLGAALMHTTGSKETNIKQRAKAKHKGYLLNEKGLWMGGKRLQCSKMEKGIYKELGLDWIEPEDR